MPNHAFIACIVLVCLIAPVPGRTLFVDDASANGDGTLQSPFNVISSGLSAAGPGDTISVFPGTYISPITTMRDGYSGRSILLKAMDSSNRPVLSVSGRVLDITTRYFVIDGYVLDGRFGGSDVVRVRSTAANAIIRNCEIRNGMMDGIDISSADSVLITHCRIHHMLAGDFANQADAHGIAATGEKHLTITNCAIYYCSGDCFQTDPNRGLPLWDSVRVENCTLWTGPLPADAALWKAGQVPGENAIDTKTCLDATVLASSYRPHLTLRNIISYGFMPGYISNRAAFNIKEKNETLVENCVVYGNEIAFRLRGDDSSAHVVIKNCIAYDNLTLIRAEDTIRKLHVYNCTFDQSGTWIQKVAGGYAPNGFQMKNCLYVGTKPSDAAHASNLSAVGSWFRDVGDHDYYLTAGCPAINAGVNIPEVIADIEGRARPSGGYDIGAYEFQPAAAMRNPRSRNLTGVGNLNRRTEMTTLGIQVFAADELFTISGARQQRKDEQSFRKRRLLLNR